MQTNQKIEDHENNTRGEHKTLKTNKKICLRDFFSYFFFSVDKLLFI